MLPSDETPSEDDVEVQPGMESTDEDVDSEDWLDEQQHRRLLRLLHDAIAEHIVNGDFVPSIELERAMENARGEIAWS
jgi:hypothetical protein